MQQQHMLEAVATHILVHHLLRMDLLRMVEVVHSLGEDKEATHLNHLLMIMLLQDLAHIKVLVSQVDLAVALVMNQENLVVHQHRIR